MKLLIPRNQKNGLFYGCALLSLSLLTACAGEPISASQNNKPVQTENRAAIAPEIALGWVEKPEKIAKKYLAVTANVAASSAAAEIMEKNGNAIDAAIAAQAVLNVVEPQSSGIGGGGFLLYNRARDQKLFYYDGREVAPASATSGMFLDAKGVPLPHETATIGGQAVGVPGLVRMLAKAHAENGKLKWSELFAPAIQLARKGFPLSARLRAQLAASGYYRKLSPADFSRYTDKNGNLFPTGTIIYNQPLAKTFERLANNGAEEFYNGQTALDIVNTVRNAPVAPVEFVIGDLQKYQPKSRPPVCITYRIYRVCGPGAPSSGGITVLQALKMLEKFDMAKLDPYGAKAAHLMISALRLAYADRNQYIADDDFVSVPTDALLDPQYIALRASKIDPERVFPLATPGDPSDTTAMRSVASIMSAESPSTTHLSIVDAEGNALSFTSTIEQAFGSGLATKSGFLLNNQMTDFDFEPVSKSLPVLNAPQAFKRPRSSMSPFIVYHANGKPYLVIGSPGGSRIIGFVLPRLVAILDVKRPLAEALSAPNLAAFYADATVEIEKLPAADQTAYALEDQGYAVIRNELTSGLHAILYQKTDGYVGAADPRREGEAVGK